VIDIAPNPAQVGQEVTFDGSGSSAGGPSEEITGYAWDLNGDGTFGDQSGATVTEAYSTPATIEIGLRVTDKDGEFDDAFVTFRVNAPPTARFIFEPATPAPGEQVTFSSTSFDSESPISAASHVWDLDGDGAFDDGTGSTVTRSFSRAGAKQISLQVTDADGATSQATRTVTVRRPEPRLLTPFPIVRLAGELRRDGATKVEKLSVRASKGTGVRVRCKGTGCPFDHKKRTVRERRVKFAKLERVLQPNVVIKVFVSRRGRIGKFTMFKFRNGKPPKRTDRCLAPNGRKPIACPRRGSRLQ
jgi:PKD domain